MFLPEVAAVGAEVGVEAVAAVAVESSEIGAGTAGEVAANPLRTMASDLGSSMSDVAGSATRTPGGFTQVMARDAMNDQEALAGDSAGSQSSNSLARVTDSDNAPSGSSESGGGGGAQSLLDGGDDFARFTQPSDQAEQDNKRDQEIERRNSQRSPVTGKPVEEQHKLTGREKGDGAARDAEGREDASISKAQDTADSRERILSVDRDPASPDAIRERAAAQLKDNMAKAVLDNPRDFDAQLETANRTARVEAETSQARDAQEMAEATQRNAQTRAETDQARAEIELHARPEQESRTQIRPEEKEPAVHEEPEARASQTEPGKSSAELELYRRPVEDREATEPRLSAVRAEQAELAEVVDGEIMRDNEHLGRSEQQSLRDQERARAMQAIEDAEIVEEVELLDEVEMRMADREAQARARREEEQQARQARMAEEQQEQEIQQQRLQEERQEREREVQEIIEQEQMRLRTQAARDKYVQSEVDGLDQDLQDLLNNPEKFGPARPEPRMVGDNGPDAAQRAPRGEGGEDGTRSDEELVGAGTRGATLTVSHSFGPRDVRSRARAAFQAFALGQEAASAGGARVSGATRHSHIRKFFKNAGGQAVIMGGQGMAAHLGQGAGLADQVTQQ